MSASEHDADDTVDEAEGSFDLFEFVNTIVEAVQDDGMFMFTAVNNAGHQISLKVVEATAAEVEAFKKPKIH